MRDDAAGLPHARNNPPWGECGDPLGPDFGAVFAWRAAGDALALTYDRRGLRHAVTLLRPGRLGEEIVLQGRRFAVVRAGDLWAPL